MKFSSLFPGIFLSFLLFLFLFKVMAEDMGAGQVDQQALNELVSGGSNSGTEVNRGRKTSWPEVVGLTVEEAEKKIKEEMPTALIKVVPTDSFVTMDYVQRRVRIYVDPSGKVVARPPRIG